MKPTKAQQLIQNQLRQIDTFSRMVIQDLATIQRLEAKDLPHDYERGRLCGFQLSIAIIASDLGPAFATHVGQRPHRLPIPPSPSVFAPSCLCVEKEKEAA